MNEAIAHGELFGLGRILVKQIDQKRAPLISTGMKGALIDEQIASAYCLRSQSIEQGYFGSRSNANLNRESFFKRTRVRFPKYFKCSLTIGVFYRLLFFRRLRYDFDFLAAKQTDFFRVHVKHFQSQWKILPFVRVWYEQCLCRSEILFICEFFKKFAWKSLKKRRRNYFAV